MNINQVCRSDVVKQMNMQTADSIRLCVFGSRGCNPSALLLYDNHTDHHVYECIDRYESDNKL